MEIGKNARERGRRRRARRLDIGKRRGGCQNKRKDQDRSSMHAKFPWSVHTIGPSDYGRDMAQSPAQPTSSARGAGRTAN